MPIAPDEPIVIVGAGGLGLNAIAVLKAIGHANVIVVDTNADKCSAALSSGATKVVHAGTGSLSQQIMEAAEGPIPAAIDLVNGESTARSLFEALRKGGKLIQVGLFGGQLTVPLPQMALRALTIRGSF